MERKTRRKHFGKGYGDRSGEEENEEVIDCRCSNGGNGDLVTLVMIKKRKKKKRNKM